MIETMTQDTKDRIADLERQRIDLTDRIEMLSYTKNHVKMVELEQKLFEVEVSISKLTA